jgi:hypothetical protein
MIVGSGGESRRQEAEYAGLGRARLLDLVVMLIGGPLKHFHVAFARLAREPLESLSLTPALIGQVLQRGPQALGFLPRRAPKQLAGEPESTLLEGERVLREGLVGALDLLEDLFELLLGSLVVHQLPSLPSYGDDGKAAILEKQWYSASGRALVWRERLAESLLEPERRLAG